jgi:hypothetical protein
VDRRDRTALGDVAIALVAVVGVVCGIMVVWVGAFYAATVDGTPATYADRRTGALLVVAGTLVAVAGPVWLAVRSRRRWPWAFVLLVLAMVAALVHRWPPVAGDAGAAGSRPAPYVAPGGATP